MKNAAVNSSDRMAAYRVRITRPRLTGSTHLLAGGLNELIECAGLTGEIEICSGKCQILLAPGSKLQPQSGALPRVPLKYPIDLIDGIIPRSEERRVGKECR